ncbi:NAD-dependent protein deacetylase [Nitriliruptoraceae bacterium ZYF776]|nr:NAD-dependent protein deacetylase [Profundirhabdus halotolerans]
MRDTGSDDLRALRELFARGRVLVLTGAGISTDSGIPDYRDATGRRRHAAPMTYDRFCGSEVERQRYWARSHLGWERIGGARPNVSHLVVAQLQQAGLVDAIVTQNVDGLHTAAGSTDVIDLHGRLDAVVCLGCGSRRPRIELGWRLDCVNPGFRERARRDTPGGAVRPDGDVVLDDEVTSRFRVVSCRRCGGVLKPDVVFFGEHVPRERFHRALAHLDEAASLVVLGSSLAVGSGYRFVTAARRRGLPVAIVSRGVTRGDGHATVRVDADLATTLTHVGADLVGHGSTTPARMAVTDGS